MDIDTVLKRSQYLNEKLLELESRSASLSEELKEKKHRYILLEKAQEIIKSIVKQTQKELSFNLSTISTTALDALFPGTKFELDFIEKRKGVECSFLLIDENGNQLDDPLLCKGGGVVDLLSFSLRISCLLLSKPDKILILDETFKYLSRDLQVDIGSLISELSSKLGIQFIFITHESDIAENIEQAKIVSVSELKENE